MSITDNYLQLGKHLFHKLYYLPVEKKEFTSIYIHLSIWNQEGPIKYIDDDSTTPTKVVLHFRRTKLEKLPEGIAPFRKYHIKKMVGRRNRCGITEVLVHWTGFDPSFDSWIPMLYLRHYGYLSKTVLCDAVQ